MSSSTAMNKYSGGVAKYRSSEGKTVKVKYKGPVEDTINNIFRWFEKYMYLHRSSTN